MENILPKLSIIVPIYNVEPYISRCFNSLYAQDLDENLFEVIAVNDGTPDKSMVVVDEYARKHGNLRVINQTNRGVSVARNVGLEASHGEFILFVDPDDWIEKNVLKRIYNYLLLNSSVEVLILRSFINAQIEREKYAWNNKFDERIPFTGVSLIVEKYNRGSVWGGVYKKDFLQRYKILFPVGVKNGEDTIFINIIFCFTKQVVFLDIPFYYIYERVGSASRSFTIERVFSYKNNLSFISQYEKMCHGLLDEQKMVFDKMKYWVISTAVHYYIRLGGKDWKKLENELMLSSVLPIRLNKKFFSKNYIMKVNLLNFSFGMYFMGMRLLCILRQI